MIQGVGIILITPDQKVLLNKRDANPRYYKNLWSYLGGGIDDGENHEQAGLRELEEETGYKTDSLNFLTSEIYDHESGKKQTRHVYWCIYDGLQQIECNEGLEMRFVTIEEMEKLDLIPGQKELIKLALEQHKNQNG